LEIPKAFTRDDEGLRNALYMNRGSGAVGFEHGQVRVSTALTGNHHC
jgi:hypothetical protein